MILTSDLDVQALMKFGQAAVVAESRRDEQDDPMNAPWDTNGNSEPKTVVEHRDMFPACRGPKTFNKKTGFFF